MKKTVTVVVAVLAVAVLLASPISAQAQVAAAVSGVEVVRSFSPARDKPLTQTAVAADQGGWRIDPASPGPVRLFEVAGSTCESCRLIYRAKVWMPMEPLPASMYLALVRGAFEAMLWMCVSLRGRHFGFGFSKVSVQQGCDGLVLVPAELHHQRRGREGVGRVRDVGPLRFWCARSRSASSRACWNR
jgi:hypothetical protein